MARKPRVIVPNCPHHIVQRGHNRNAVFVCADDYRYYLATLKEWKQYLNIKVYGYCLMTNHVHLIVEPGEDVTGVSELMKRLAGRQTRYVNKLEGRRGTLWEGRYKISPIQQDAYLMQCCRYVDLNPVKAKMVARAEDYLWSSYQEKIGLVANGWLDLDPCYMSYTNPRVMYKKFVEEGISSGEQQFLQAAVASSHLTGDLSFVDEIENRMGIRVECRRPGRPKKVSVKL